MNLEAAVKTFHHRHGQPIGDTPQLPTPELARLRRALIIEEATELLAALAAGDLANIAKEAADLIYVTVGLCVTYGIPLNDVFRAVHAANMQKTVGAVRDDGKILKGPDYVAPDVAGVMGLSRRRHLSECWLQNYPQDRGARCTCDDNYPDPS